MARLTALGVANAKAGSARRELSDHGNGLFLVIQPSGHKSWACRYRRPDGSPAKLTFGAWPAVSLAEARKLAATALHELSLGNDPALARKEAKIKAVAAKADTVIAICEEFLQREGRKLRTADQRERIFRRLVYPAIGDRQIDTLKRSEVVRMLDKIEDNSGQRMADVTLAALRRVFNWHATRSDTFVPPIVRGMGRQNVAEHRRTRTLGDSEIRQIWTAATVPEAQPFANLIKLALLTSARRGELSAMTWDEVDADHVWTLPASRSKTKTEIVRPLSKAAQAILAEQPKVVGVPWVFSAPGTGPLRSFSECKKRFDATSGVTNWRIHDTRRTARSLLSRAGINVDICERALGHAMPANRARYDTHRYIDELRHAFEMLAIEIERIVNPPRGNVVPMVRG
jgi:integrase